MIYTKFFKDLGKFDAPIAGGKGASLGEMTQAGIPVPGGYVVLSETFEKFIHATDLAQEIDAILDKVDHKAIHTIDQASEDIRSLILSREMPDEIKTEIMESFAELNAEFVAVRSSATAEDGTDHAWAGQLESYLNVTHDDVLEKVQHCWSSLFTPRAIFYRFEKGLHTTKISVAVVVQKMVNSEKSGIAFSVHPVTEDRNQIIIEAGYGLGEAIVSGSVTPDSYVIEKEPRRIIDVSVNHQNRAMYRKGNNGNEWIDLDDAKASSQVLDEPEILELSTIIMRIENRYGFPCDIEWAYELGEFFIVQSRPITTLSAIETSEKKDEFISPELKDFKPEEYHFDGLWKNDLFPTCFWQDCWVPDVVEKLGLDLQGVGVMNLQGGHFLVHKPTRAIMDRQMKKMVDEKNSAFFKNLIHVSDEIFTWALEKGDSLKTKEPTVENFRDFVATAKRLNFLWLIGATYTNWPIEEKLQEAVIADQFPPEHVLDIVPKIITPLHDYQHGLVDLKKEIVGRTLEQVKDDKEFFGKLTEYAQKYVWVETFNFIGEPMNPERLYDQVIHLENKEDTHVDFKPEKPLSEKLQFAAECLHDVGYVKQGGAEYFSMFSEKVIPFLNTVADKIGVTYREFMCLLTDEIDQALQGKLNSDELKKRAASRIGVNNWAVIGDKTGKMIFIDNVADVLSLVDKMIPRTGADATEFIGQIGNRGKYTGPARIIMNTYDFNKIQQGDVLVTTMTTPDFIVLMQKSGAIVTDIGGLLCHAAIVSREMKKPCVIGTKFATQILKDGDMVEVDADNGIVRILKKKNKIDLVKEYTRDTTIIMQEAWGICCGTYIKDLLNLTNPYRPGIIHYMNDGSIEIWENKQSTQWLMDAILEKNTSDPTFLPQIIESYKKQLEEIKNYWKDGYLHDLNQFPDFFEKVKQALGGFIPYYYSAVDERTPKALREMALELRDKDEFFAINDVFIRDTLLKHYPTIRGFETNVFSDEVINLPDISILKDRRNHMTLIDGVERTIETLDQLSNRKPELNFISEKLEFAGQEIVGQIAFKGNVTGIVRILRRRDQVDEVQIGEIIVSPMTTPDFMPAMQKAAAFVTDEGGITCHAAIVAREMAKPCIIGTKIATQILHDGDMVEVDANTGTVKILERNNTMNFHKEYTRDYTYIMQEGWYDVILNKFTRYGGKQNPFVPPVLFYMNDGAIEVWENSQATPWILDTLQEKIKSDPLFIPGMLDQHERELSHMQEYWNKGFVTSKEELKEFIRLAHEYMYAFDFMYYSGVDERTPPDIRARALTIRDADKYFGTCDDVIRASIRAIYPELKGLENTLLVNDIDNIPSRQILEGRKRASLMVGHTVNIGLLSEFQRNHSEYKFNIEIPETTETKTLKGQIGNKGFGKGKVRILKRKDQIDEMQEGEILVSAMTTPEFVPAMQKAAAIITDEGGITCHAAIVARELGKPCVIGTKFATQILKNGDMVEVDADNGIVTLLK